MPSFGDSIFLFILALLLFGPKKLPVLARELGKWIGEFRRASNEFKMQMEEELRQVEQADRQKQIAAMEAAAPVAPPLEEPQSLLEEQPHLASAPEDTTSLETDSHNLETDAANLEDSHPETQPQDLPSTQSTEPAQSAPLPIATSGDLSIMPPSTGLPTPRSKTNPLGSLLDSIPNSILETGNASVAVADAPDIADTAVAVEGEAHVR